MAKKKDKSKCPTCGRRLALASLNAFDIEVEFDQEPYEADVIEPVIVGKEEVESVFIELSGSVHVCPKCAFVQDFDRNV